MNLRLVINSAKILLARIAVGRNDAKRAAEALEMSPDLRLQEEWLAGALAFVAGARVKLAADPAEGTDPQLATWAALAQAMFASAEFRYLMDVGNTTIAHVAGK